MIGKILSKIHNPADLHKLSEQELMQLPQEIRHLIKTSVSRQGGHLASNLGVVELTMALHYVFDFARDRLVWDVGHQCYVHKILTGRADRFDKLRQADGISGFPSPDESDYDPFYVGHAGTAIASGLGLALGAQYQKSDEKIVAVAGDASIVNGLSFEGLNNTQLCQRQFLIILNDNFMAIDKTQGAFAQYLTKVRVSKPVEDLQRRTKLIVKRLPVFGDQIHEVLHRFKGGLRTTLMGSHRFEQLGIPFLGPVDGHDLPSMIRILEALKEFNYPVILHVQTRKGKGFEPAIEDPAKFHSPKPFKVDGETASFEKSLDKSFTTAFSEALERNMEADKRIVALTAAMPDGTGLVKLRRKFPGRIIDVGIAESVAVDIAAGLAKNGMIPVVAIYSTFMQRAFDQVFQEVSLQNLPVIFCMDRAGLVGGDGAVHHGFTDIATMRVLPNMVLMAPVDDADLDAALSFAIKSGRPCALRYPRDVVPTAEKYVKPEATACASYQLGKSVWLRAGRDVVILAYGAIIYQALQAAEQLASEGINVGVVNCRFAKPLDEQLLNELLGKGSCNENENRNSDANGAEICRDDKGGIPIITLEEHALQAGFGSAVLEYAQEHHLDTRGITRLGLPDFYIKQNSRMGQLQQVGIDSGGIVKAVQEIIHSRQVEVSGN